MIRSTLALVVFLLGSSASARRARAPRAVNLSVGTATTVSFDASLEKVKVVNPRIADVHTSGKRALQVVGRQVGETTILVWDQSGVVHRLVVDVGLPTAGLTAKLRALFPNERIAAYAVGKTVVLGGSVGDPIVVKRATQMAQAYVKNRAKGTRILNFVRVRGRQQVQLRVKIAEVARTALRQIGINAWFRKDLYSAGLLSAGSGLSTSTAPNLGNGTVLQPGGSLQAPQQGAPVPLAHLAGPLANSAFGLHFATAGNATVPLSIALNLLQGRGLAKILSEPTLVAYSGQKANFLAGGEFPVPIPQALGQSTIEFKKFGVALGFTPTVLAKSSIHLKLDVSVSERDNASSVTLQGTSVPGLTTRRAATSVRLRSGQSFAIAGLLQDRVGSRSAKVPLLGDIPILGALFRRDTFEREERELVILVTAHLVRPLRPGEVPLLPGEDEISDPGPIAFFLLGSTDPELEDEKKRAGAAGPVGYTE